MLAFDIKKQLLVFTLEDFPEKEQGSRDEIIIILEIENNK